MRLSVLAARSGELLINRVLATAASERENMDFILFFLDVCLFVFNTGGTVIEAREPCYGV